MNEGAWLTKVMHRAPGRGPSECRTGDPRKSRVLRGGEAAAVSQWAEKAATRGLGVTPRPAGSRRRVRCGGRSTLVFGPRGNTDLCFGKTMLAAGWRWTVAGAGRPPGGLSALRRETMVAETAAVTLEVARSEPIPDACRRNEVCVGCFFSGNICPSAAIPMSTTFLGNGVIKDAIEFKKKSYWSRTVPEFNDWCPRREREV